MFFLLMVTITLSDWVYMVIPNSILLVGCMVGIGYWVIANPVNIANHFLSAIFSFGIMYVIQFGGSWLFKKPAMGFGDVKLAGVIGLFIGYQDFLLSLWAGAIIGLIYAMSIRIYIPKSHITAGTDSHTANSRTDDKLPFGSFLAIASFLVFCFHDDVHSWINQWLIWIQ
jgi:prepilin signal peptidase PulO-like enzyme (type II secretory pathway)